MKRLLRWGIVQSLLAWLVTAYVEVVIATLRWRVDNRAIADAALASPEGVIALFWHGRIAQGMACRPLLRDKPRRVMISLSRDGAFIARAAERLGITSHPGLGRQGRQPPRQGRRDGVSPGPDVHPGGRRDDPHAGRSARSARGPAGRTRATGSRGGLSGLPDEPRGKTGRDPEELGPRAHPLPFARGCVVLEGPLRVAADADETALEAARADWQARMRPARRGPRRC